MPVQNEVLGRKRQNIAANCVTVPVRRCCPNRNSQLRSLLPHTSWPIAATGTSLKLKYALPA
jgi:hypothetical protein